MRRLLCALIFVAAPAFAEETLVCYTAPGCGPCRQFKADLDADASIAAGRRVIVVDVERDRLAARRAKVRMTPTFAIVDDGREVRRTVGYKGAAALTAWIEMP